MKFLTKWDTEAAYDAAKDNLATPQVAVVTETNTVNYKPYVDPYVGHDYVDLGLPSGTKWATMNVGASSESDYGEYYKYGSGATPYTADTSQTCYNGTEIPLAASADTATQVWGGSWHMPTNDQCQELINNTTREWVTIDGTNGVKFIAQNGNYVFLPAAGSYLRGTLGHVGDVLLYWTSSPFGSDEAYGVNGSYYNGAVYVSTRDVGRPIYGCSIRPVVG